ncbi:hypothetical protein TorRG33x02_308450 [Trema orientale]|uniref:Uncharacterized protein n=1 Tax=Trema orientale TaxID=63057 RepID=A0A2P5BUD9_TREOI|nr:hypothetical protein TorRG33x02_308450 [Trema orientale]
MFNKLLTQYLRDQVIPTTLSWVDVKMEDIDLILQHLESNMKRHFDRNDEMANIEAAKKKPYRNVKPADWDLFCIYFETSVFREEMVRLREEAVTQA